ncbi:MAG: hypothetical protein QW404_00865 [Candidatus Nanoarchaeia archaeon]
MKRAQGSFEILVAIALMTFMFLILVFLTFDRRSDLFQIEDVVTEKSECMKVSNMITGLYVSGPKTNITFKLTKNVNVDGSSGVVETAGEGYICKFSHTMVGSPDGNSSFDLYEGYVIAENINGTVVMYNV